MVNGGIGLLVHKVRLRWAEGCRGRRGQRPTRDTKKGPDIAVRSLVIGAWFDRSEPIAPARNEILTPWSSASSSSSTLSPTSRILQTH